MAGETVFEVMWRIWYGESPAEGAARRARVREHVRAHPLAMRLGEWMVWWGAAVAGAGFLVVGVVMFFYFGVTGESWVICWPLFLTGGVFWVVAVGVSVNRYLRVMAGRGEGG